jgi:hypothetical protein
VNHNLDWPEGWRGRAMECESQWKGRHFNMGLEEYLYPMMMVASHVFGFSFVISKTFS